MKSRDLIFVAIFTLITVFLWMVFEVMHTVKKTTISTVVAEQMKPIVPRFDTKLLMILKERQIK